MAKKRIDDYKDLFNIHRFSDAVGLSRNASVVLSFLISGYSKSDIAKLNKLKPHDVRGCVREIKRKLCVRSTAAIVRKYRLFIEEDKIDSHNNRNSEAG